LQLRIKSIPFSSLNQKPQTNQPINPPSTTQKRRRRREWRWRIRGWWDGKEEGGGF